MKIKVIVSSFCLLFVSSAFADICTIQSGGLYVVDITCNGQEVSTESTTISGKDLLVEKLTSDYLAKGYKIVTCDGGRGDFRCIVVK